MTINSLKNYKDQICPCCGEEICDCPPSFWPEISKFQIIYTLPSGERIRGMSFCELAIGERPREAMWALIGVGLKGLEGTFRPSLEMIS